jgi:hypothetical protein
MRGAILVAAIGVVAMQPALAAEKAGSWTRVTQTQILDPNGTLPSLDPIAVRKIMKSSGTTTMTYCSVENAPPVTTFKMTPTTTCKMIDPVLEGATFHTDFACHGDTSGKGKMTITYDTAEHYTGESNYSPELAGSLKWKSTFVGQWTGPTCATPAAP